MTKEVEEEVGVTIGVDYPEPIDCAKYTGDEADYWVYNPPKYENIYPIQSDDQNELTSEFKEKEKEMAQNA